jgi:tetratricopeptide (TPR) repeat protein
MRTKACSVVLFLVATAGTCTFTYGQGVPGYPDNLNAYDAREVAMLPMFCKFTQDFRGHVAGGDNKDEIARLRAVLGDAYEHMHHYCWGLMKTNRGVLLARDPQIRRAYLTDSIGEFDYVIGRAPPDFVLLPEILTKKGENLIRLGKGPNGVLELERAAELKPDYWPPYAQLADYYKSVGEPNKAMEVVQRGLMYSPDAVALSRRLQELRKAKAPSKTARGSPGIP